MAVKTKKVDLEAARAEQLGAGAFRAALTDFLVEARKTLQVVKVAALTHAAVQFSALASEYDDGDAERSTVEECSRRCEKEARAQLGHVTG